MAAPPGSAPVQPRLFEFRMLDWAADSLLIGPANADAARALQGWADWPGRALALLGPHGSGKTHLGRAWASQVGAVVLGAGELKGAGAGEAAWAGFDRGRGRMFIDDADTGLDDFSLTRLLDRARLERGALLLTGQQAPTSWPARSADLVSRLAALPSVSLNEPDPDLLAALLQRLCRQRYLALEPRLAQYLAARMERSFAAAHALADAFDTITVRGARPIGLGDARAALARLAGGGTGAEQP